MLHLKTKFLILIFSSITFFAIAKENFTLVIFKEEKKIQFNIEIAQSNEERAKGLMFRKNLPQNEGMLFIFPKSRIIKMWMKNTYIPLDIIFISNDKEIVDLKHNMKELSNSIIISKTTSKYALEINAGLINKLNLKIGDKIYFNE